jgi:uncharacterized glyoxalase superfamily protein PhnB
MRKSRKESAAEMLAIMPVLRVRGLAKSIRWYKTLGFDLAWKQPNEGGGRNSMLTCGRVSLMLSTGRHLGGKPAFTGTLYFETKNVRALYEMALKNRFKFVWPLEEMAYGTLEFGIRDPDGYVLAFAQETR